MAGQYEDRFKRCAGHLVLCLELAAPLYLLLRMLESVLQDLGFHTLDTAAPLAVVIYLAFATQICLVFNWSGTSPNPLVPGGFVAEAWRDCGAGVAALTFVLVSEVSLAMYGALTGWVGLMWDVLAVVVLQVLVSAALFLASDLRSWKDRNHDGRVQDVLDMSLALRRRRPGG